MKYIKNRSFPSTGLFIWFVVILCTSYLFVGCKWFGHSSEEEPLKLSSVNLVLKQSKSDAEIKQKIVAAMPGINPASINIKRCPCDPNLVNITLPNNWIFEGHDGEVAVKPRSGGSGGDTDLNDFGALSLNNNVSSFDTDAYGAPEEGRQDDKRTQALVAGYYGQIIAGPKSDSKVVKIAVLDSGIDPTYMPGPSWQVTTNACSASGVASVSDVGWNFSDGTFSTNTQDDQPIRHGTRVSYLIAQQFLGDDIPVKIIPMKVLNSQNQGDLFSILCALETARENNVDIINMSLGYYGDRDSVFADYLKRSTDQGIWIVTAAGNQDKAANERKLSAMAKPFYPAMFSKDNERIFAVTTIGATSCERQNYDAGFVVGVQQDAGCRFKLTPASGTPLLIFGTSYASPILTGWIGRSIRETPLPATNQRRALLDRMGSSAVPDLFEGRSISRQSFTP